MRLFWSGGNQGFWLGPALLGVLLILIGGLLYVMPELLAYVVAGIFILAGCGLLGSAWRMRQRVTYQRIDNPRQVRDQEPPPGW